jgi:hypothetical protein
MTTNKASDNIQAYQEMPKPNPDLKRLDRLVGTWKVSDPSGAGAVSGHIAYELKGGHDGRSITRTGRPVARQSL